MYGPSYNVGTLHPVHIHACAFFSRGPCDRYHRVSDRTKVIHGITSIHYVGVKVEVFCIQQCLIAGSHWQILCTLWLAGAACSLACAFASGWTQRALAIAGKDSHKLKIAPHVYVLPGTTRWMALKGRLGPDVQIANLESSILQGDSGLR